MWIPRIRGDLSEEMDFIVLTSEATNVFKSFLGSNWSCLEQDHSSVLAEAIWSARGEEDRG